MLHENLCLIANRQSKEPFAVLSSELLTERKIAAVYDASSTFPLYLYPTNDSSMFDAPTDAPGGRRPNLEPRFVTELSEKLGLEFIPDGQGDLVKTFGPEDVLHYIYAVFHAPSYRARYAEFLKIDFPRVPLTSNLELFRSLAAKGHALLELHLMRRQGSIMTRYPVAGSNEVDKVRYVPEGRVYTNPQQYFEGVPQAVWGFHIGGYQVLDKWLKDRKGRTLSFDELAHYQRIVSALYETLGLMDEIDEAIEVQGGWPLS